MGSLNNQIGTIMSDDGLTKEEKNAQIQEIKRSEYDTKISALLPYTLNVDADRRVTFLGDGSFNAGFTPNGSAFVECNVSFERNTELDPDGAPGVFTWVEEYNGPWKVVNPPLLVPDPDGPQDVIIGGSNYREDALAVLLTIIDRSFP